MALRDCRIRRFSSQNRCACLIPVSTVLTVVSMPPSHLFRPNESLSPCLLRATLFFLSNVFCSLEATMHSLFLREELIRSSCNYATTLSIPTIRVESDGLNAVVHPMLPFLHSYPTIQHRDRSSLAGSFYPKICYYNQFHFCYPS